MSNEYFKTNTLEEYNEAFEKWRVLTDNELCEISVKKSRIFVSVADMDLILDAFESAVANGLTNSQETRRIMQMGYALEEIKEKLKKRIALEALRDERNAENG
jgi:hypothetical protein